MFVIISFDCIPWKLDGYMGSQRTLVSALRCLIMGPPGSGKGTIASRIVKDFQLTHLSCGDIMRSHIRQQTDLGNKIAQYLKEGKLVPDELTSRLMATELDKLQNHSVLLDGYPRTRNQASYLQQHHPVTIVLDLKVPFPVIVDRLSDRWIHEPSGRVYNLHFNPPRIPGRDDITGEPLIQREDDKPETVLKRLETYSLWEGPLANYYQKLNLLKTFSGNETNKIWPEVFQYLSTLMPPVQKSIYQ